MEYEDRLRISTPEGVELELTLAGVGSRFTASLIDHAIQFAIVLASFVLFGQLSDTERVGAQLEGESDVALGAAVIAVWTFLVFVAYDVLFEVRASGRTPGKRLTGLRVVRSGGQPVGFVTSAVRNIVRLVDALPGFYGVGMAVMFGSRRNQRLGDMAAGTVVVRERKGGRGGTADAGTAGTAAAAGTLVPDVSGWDVSGVGAEDVRTVRRFLERRAALTTVARGEIARDLAARLRPRVAGTPEDLGPETFLEGVSAAKAARDA